MKGLIAIVGGALLALGLVSAAGADPVRSPGAETFDLVCDNGESYEIVVAGNGEWTPAHLIGSKSMLIPTGFLAFEGTVYDAEGNILEQFEEGATYKGSPDAPKNRNLVICTFDVFFEDPDSGMTFEGSGTVQGFITPAKR